MPRLRGVPQGGARQSPRRAPPGAGGRRTADPRRPGPGAGAELALLPLEGRFRMAIVESAQRLNIDAQNALLKTLEEPPARVVIVLAADDSAACCRRWSAAARAAPGARGAGRHRRAAGERAADAAAARAAGTPRRRPPGTGAGRSPRNPMRSSSRTAWRDCCSRCSTADRRAPAGAQAELLEDGALPRRLPARPTGSSPRTTGRARATVPAAAAAAAPGGPARRARAAVPGDPRSGATSRATWPRRPGRRARAAPGDMLDELVATGAPSGQVRRLPGPAGRDRSGAGRIRQPGAGTRRPVARVAAMPRTIGHDRRERVEATVRGCPGRRLSLVRGRKAARLG
jgi:hypothetical protein